MWPGLWSKIIQHCMLYLIHICTQIQGCSKWMGIKCKQFWVNWKTIIHKRETITEAQTTRKGFFCNRRIGRVISLVIVLCYNIQVHFITEKNIEIRSYFVKTTLFYTIISRLFWKQHNQSTFRYNMPYVSATPSKACRSSLRSVG